MAIKISNDTIIDDNRALVTPRIDGTYINYHPNVVNSGDIDLTNPAHVRVMQGNTTYNLSNATVPRSAFILLDTTSSDLTPTFNTVVWAGDGTPPNWFLHRYWLVSITVTSAGNFAAASGYDF